MGYTAPAKARGEVAGRAEGRPDAFVLCVPIVWERGEGVDEDARWDALE